jgi:hypothetical protein
LESHHAQRGRYRDDFSGEDRRWHGETSVWYDEDMTPQHARAIPHKTARPNDVEMLQLQLEHRR